jgi:hypothetical protein
MEKIKNKKDVIVINRMYVGDYLNSNLGHEVINMFTADDGKHYLYLNAYGSFASQWQYRIGNMLLTKYHSKNCVEVIGKAVGLKDVYDYRKDGSNRDGGDISNNQKGIIENISYGTVKLEKLFSDAERQSVYITFSADKVFRINSKDNKKIFIHYLPQKSVCQKSDIKVSEDKIENAIRVSEDKIDVYLLNNKLALASLNQFVKNDNEDYDILNDIINDNLYDDFWFELNESDKVKLPENYFPRKDNIFDICQIQDNENCFSNALAYFMDKYRELFIKFFERYEIKLLENFKIKREENAKITDKEYKEQLKVQLHKTDTEIEHKVDGGRIDILLKDSKNLIVIENKIKSDINSVAGDTEDGQLKRYVNYAQWICENTNTQPYYFILTPDYNIPELSNEMKDIFKIVKFSELVICLEKDIELWKNDSNMLDFVETLKRHTKDNVNDYLYDEMLEKLYKRINNKTENAENL